MERRGARQAIALIALAAILILLVYVEYLGVHQQPTTAYAPAGSEETLPSAEAPGDVASSSAPAPSDENHATAGEEEGSAVAIATPPVAPSEPATPAEPAMPSAPAQAEVPPAPGVPSFDVVRVEPSGDATLAGQAEPGVKVDILDGPKVIATTEANPQGEWAIPLEAPLPPGSHDLAIRTTTPDGATETLSDQRVAVSVPDKGSSDVLVVVNEPDAASKVLQAAPAAEQQAVNEPKKDESVAMLPPASPTPTPPPAPAPAPEVVPPPAEAPMASAPPAATPSAPEVAPPPTEVPMASAPPMAPPTPSTPLPPPAAEAPETSVAPAEPPPAPPSPAKPEPEVRVAAVESQSGGQVYVSGSAATEDTVRVYIDDEALGDAQPTPSGQWALQGERDLAAGNYTVRADQIDSSGKVIARSEVPFELESGVEVAVLKPSGTVGSAASTSASVALETGNIVIKRGDNLWTIARKTWGRGVRWSTIYQANSDQIRNPDLIYPGQVFVMPEGDLKYDAPATVQD